MANRFSGVEGRIATMEDVIRARLNARGDQYPWNAYFTTNSAEYLGRTKGGNLVLIVAHGVGPMSTLDGVLQAYSHEYKDKSGYRRGGRITESQFQKLESGGYGPVTVFDYLDYRTEHPGARFRTALYSRLLDNPLFKARVGSQAEEYLKNYSQRACEWLAWRHSIHPYSTPIDHHRRQGSDILPYYITSGFVDECPYISDGISTGDQIPEAGLAIGHLLAITALQDIYSSATGDGVIHEVGLQSWSNGARLVAIENGVSTENGIHPGPDPERYLSQYWQQLLIPVGQKIPMGIRALMKLGDQRFTQVLKQGIAIDSYEPEYRVTNLEPIGPPRKFSRLFVSPRDQICKYDIGEMRTIAPDGANVYELVGQPETEFYGNEPKLWTCMVQFYRAKIDRTKRLMSMDELSRNYELLEKLHRQEVATP